MWESYIIRYEVNGICKEAYISATSKSHAVHILLSSGVEDISIRIKSVNLLTDKFPLIKY